MTCPVPWVATIQMRFRLELLERHRGPTQTRMLAIDDANEPVVEQLLLKITGLQLREKAEGQIDLAGFKLSHRLLRGIAQIDPYARRG